MVFYSLRWGRQSSHFILSRAAASSEGHSFAAMI